MTRYLLSLALLMSVSSAAFAQSRQGPAQARGWLDVNVISLRSVQDEQTYTLSRTLFDETATAATAYPKLPSAKGVGLDGGFQFHPRVGVGIHFGGVNYDSTVGLAVRIPHPDVFNRFGTDENTTASPLKRKDRSFDVSMMFTPLTPDRWRVRLFAGPTYFTVSQEMVEVIEYDQVYFFNGTNIVTITSFTGQEVEGSAWGFHGGADIAYFFARNVGVGGVIRMNRGTVTIDEEPFSGDSAKLKVGHVTLGAGLRLRF